MGQQGQKKTSRARLEDLALLLRLADLIRDADEENLGGVKTWGGLGQPAAEPNWTPHPNAQI